MVNSQWTSSFQFILLKAIVGAVLLINLVHGSHQGTLPQSKVTSDQAKAVFEALKPQILKVPQVSANEKENVTLTCNATGYPEPKISWAKDNKTLENSRYHVNGPKLTVYGIKFEDQGAFFCQAENIFGKASTPMKVIVHGAPRLVEHPRARTTGYTGKTTFIPCKAVGNPAPTFMWTRSHNKPLPQGRHKVTRDGLDIYRTSAADVGHYVCIGIDPRMKPRNAVTWLKVKDVEPPIFTVSPPSTKKVTRINDSVRIRCEAKGDPRPVVTWSFNGAIVKANTNTIGNRESSELVIRHFQLKDEGTYKCVAKNKYGNLVEKQMRLDLISCGYPGTPRYGFKIGYKYRVGDSVTFGCNSGYDLLGPQVRVCLPNGIWSNNFMVACRRFYAPYKSSIRLVGGTNRYEGRVEIKHNGVWGTVCDDYWDIFDADVVCRQLGFRRAHAAPHRAKFGQGSGKIWLDDVKCIGKDFQLAACEHAAWGTNNCSHGEDASVICLSW